MKAIVGRLSDLGLRELFRLLRATGAEGELELDTAAGRGRVWVRQSQVSGELEPAILQAALGRAGTFCFRPAVVGGVREWVTQDDFPADAGDASSGSEHWRPTADGSAAAALDPLSELRDSLSLVDLPVAAARVGVVAADQRPYRALLGDWRQRGWEVDLRDQPGWPDGPPPQALVVHVPTSTTLAGHAEPWLALLQQAASQQPAVPVLWVGGMADPHLRHQVVMGGADFLLPAPAGEVGEAARWFRDEVTLVVQRLLNHPAVEAPSEGEAFRDFFVALHADASPAEGRASLLRFASSFYARGMLFGVRDDGFESLGGYGFSMGSGVRISRGISAFEEAVIGGVVVELEALADGELAMILPALGESKLDRAAVYPVMAGADCPALFLGDDLQVSGSTSGLAALLARSGASLLGS